MKEFELMMKVGKLKDFMSLFSCLFEILFAMDEFFFFVFLIMFLFLMVKKIKVLLWENEIKIDSLCKEYLKNFLF